MNHPIPKRDSTRSTAGWKKQLAGLTRGFDDLPTQLQDRLSRGDFDAASGRFPFAITPYYLSLIDVSDPDDPIARMCIPTGEELVRQDWVSEDPIREMDHAPLPGLVRRYRDRALVLVRSDCPVYCRHCTRRIMGEGSIVPAQDEDFGAILEYLKSNPEISDVIVSGGEPLLMDDDEILRVLGELRAVSSVKILRLATRAPVNMPSRLTDDLATGLSKLAPLYVNTQFNHPRELTDLAMDGVAALVDRGVPVSNQSVLLAGVNDDPAVMEELCRGLLENRIRPYYLFMCDLVAGTGHFRVSLERGIEIMEHLRGRISGMGIPQLVVDLPGGHGKIPIDPGYVVERRGGMTLLLSPGGHMVEYPDP